MINNIKIGETYTYFDDGKLKPSRKYNVKIINIIPFDKTKNSILKLWKKEVNDCCWLYNKSTDFFIEGILEIEKESEYEKIIFVRTMDNGWFSLGYWAGRLDVDGSLTEICNKNYN